ncbi:glycosyltransferase family 25 protein [Rhizobium cremeum]|uniref:glycosyltransferase family 25 protein n=1 Tax=Rhizobium cremeum TaxID=2813827 RepID=UPI000DD5E801|nr:glycosyltransferase family 25 protein [Rhizobium cremeum]MCJ7993713.1 glycosyltransferase family 25 protein [Rhizobium cremeum]MCJ7998770.1 glycosyltransferase family 25 protein [Rhizobium cremeum]
MKIGAYVINLDRSIERWRSLIAQTAQFGMQFVRVVGVDGAAIPAQQRTDIDERAFLRQNGRLMLDGEYGCYRSHLKALSTFLESDDDAAIIIEDDVEVPPELIERAEAILAAVPEAELVKLLNHRSRWFRLRATSRLGDRIGRCLHGPQGSAACYLVTRTGAEKLLRNIRVMSYPLDIALERGWQNGVNVFTVKDNIARLSPTTSKMTEIGTRADYRKRKFRGPRRAITHLMRALEYTRRIRYAL